MNFGRFLRNLALAAVPVIAVWWVITPVYNRFLMRASENLVQLTESPDRTTLALHETHHFLISRNDVRGQTSTGHVYSVRATDVHFPTILMAVLFLATPGVSLRDRFTSLGWALLATIFFHLISLVFWVKFAYATQLGSWSMQNYTAFGRNFWGLGKHLLDLPFKFAWPLVMWIAFFGPSLLPSAPKTESDGRV